MRSRPNCGSSGLVDGQTFKGPDIQAAGTLKRPRQCEAGPLGQLVRLKIVRVNVTDMGETGGPGDMPYPTVCDAAAQP